MPAETEQAEQIKTPVVYYRGGTSKGVFVDQRDLPTNDPENLMAWILAIYGSPDERQIDGLGGADPLTSKFAIVGPPTRPGADVDYTFYQVSLTKPHASKDMNCGNISSAVGPYAIDQGFVKPDKETVTVRVHATNFDQMIYVTVNTKDGKPRVLGGQQISGVPGSSSPITVDFHETVGTHGMGLLPTGNLVDKVDIDGLGECELSIIDLTNLVIFIEADRLGLDGTEDPVAMSSNKKLMEVCEKIRHTVAVKIGLAKDMEEAVQKCTLTPFLGIVAPPKDWTEYGTQKKHKADECDFNARSTLAGQVHKAYMASGSVCTGLAALLPGTVVNQVSRTRGKEAKIRIGHPSGLLEVEIAYEKEGDNYAVKRAALIRTARRLMEGEVFAAIDRLPWLSGKRTEVTSAAPEEKSKQMAQEILQAT